MSIAESVSDDFRRLAAFSRVRTDDEYFDIARSEIDKPSNAVGAWGSPHYGVV
jgi:hypothetical protein